MSVKFSSEPELSQLDKTRKEIAKQVSAFSSLITQVVKPLPTGTGNGSDLNNDDYHTDAAEFAENSLADLGHLGITDYKTLYDVLRNQISGEMVNDKTYFMERLIQSAAKLPDTSPMSKKLTDGFLTQLYNDLQHPPQSFLSGELKYRKADGSYNSLKHPMLGAAGMPYARTVQPKTPQMVALPDAGVVFDSLMSRNKSEKHPNRISSMLFYLASIIIHDLFDTDHNDFTRSKTSSYLDLAPLYGSNDEELGRMRTGKDGKIKPDCFSEERLLLFPPGVGVLLIMFNRFHNFVADNLAEINEGARFNKPVEGRTGPHAKTWKQYDEDLFQTARLITCGLYVNCILLDYVRTILNLNKTDDNWALNPRADIDGVPVAEGNQVSAEFNLVYRWHSVISDRDEKWTEDLWNELWPGKDPKTMEMHEFLQLLNGLEQKIPKDPEKRPFNKMKRKDDGKFDDDELVKIVVESVEDCSNSFGARRVPAVMRAIEVLGIEQARAWNCATLNEFRKYFKLTPHNTFEDINPEVADQLKHLYETPDRVELYPGLVVEAAKEPMVPGSGLCTNYTISRGVLSDAVALVRGDRFYTLDYHPKLLTNWGFALVESEKEIDNGCVFSKLFMRAFPNHFRPDSVYAHYPLTVPSEMENVLKTLGKAHLYNFDRPHYTPPFKLVYSYACAEKILGDKATFNVTWGPAMEFLMGKPAKNFMLAGDGYENMESRKMMKDALYVSDWQKEVKKYYTDKSEELLKEKSYRLGDNLNQVDLVRDVGNLIHIHFAADLFLLPLKTKKNPHGLFTEMELYMILAAVFTVVFFDMDPGESFKLRLKGHKATQSLGKAVELKVRSIKDGAGILSSAMADVFPSKATGNTLEDYGVHLIQRLLKHDHDVPDLVWGHIMGTAGGMAPNQGQLFAQTIEFFLATDQGRALLPACRALALRDDDEAFDTLMRYFMEGSRLYGETGVLRYATHDTTVVDGDRGELRLRAGDRVMLHLRAASRDPAAFPHPDDVRLDRPLESYIHLGAGQHQCLGLPMTRIALTALFRTVLRECPGLRVARGPQGVVNKVEHPMGSERPEVRYHKYLTEMGNSFFPFPQTLKVNWDDAAMPQANGVASASASAGSS